jgi:3-deoxy-D-manno-octulosonic-acid transferase
VVDAGSAKYDVAARDPEAETRARAALSALGWGPGSRILLGGSTWPGEEEILLDLFSRLRPDVPGLVLLLAPRHAERRAQVAAEIGRAGLSYILRSEQRSGRPPPAEAPAVFLLDTTGELRDFYASADLIFVGKSLTAHGGQNPIEPALCGRPVVVGPHMENFRPVLADFLEADAVVQVRDAAELDGVFRRLLSDPAAASAMGGRAAALVARKSGALSRTAAAMAEWL